VPSCVSPNVFPPVLLSSIFLIIFNEVVSLPLCNLCFIPVLIYRRPLLYTVG
jgi:hypothetical protein